MAIRGRGQMNRRLVVGVVLLSFLVGAVILNRAMPSRLTQERMLASERMAVILEQAKTALRSYSDEQPENVQADSVPEPFSVLFECSNGSFTVRCEPSWAPLGCARLKEAVEAGVYDGAYFFRVMSGFVVQFGIPSDPELANRWRDSPIDDDPVLESNTVGMMSFANSGTHTRTTQLFINLQDNSSLDARGFAPIGRVIEGLDVVEAITAEYGEMPAQGRNRSEGKAYLDAEFPDMDFIRKATLLEPDPQD